MDHIPEISQLAATALRDALAAAERDDIPALLGHLMSIDAASWTGITARLAAFGPTWPALILARLTPLALLPKGADRA